MVQARGGGRESPQGREQWTVHGTSHGLGGGRTVSVSHLGLEGCFLWPPVITKLFLGPVSTWNTPSFFPSPLTPVPEASGLSRGSLCLF